MSWGSLVLKVNGERFYGFTAVNDGQKRERVLAYGMGRHHAPTAKSAGKYTPDPVKITGWKSSIQAVRKALAALASDGVSYGNVTFQMVLQAVEPGEEPITKEYIDCTIQAESTGHEENPDPLKEDVEILCRYIRTNGLTLFDSSEGSP